MEEIWKDVKGFEGSYQASSLGRVKSFKLGREALKTLRVDKDGYYQTTLHLNGKRYFYKVHQIVAMAFHGHVPNGNVSVINHKDFDRKNNKPDNLEIVTSRENSNRKHLKSTSKYTGVSWNKKCNKWAATIGIGFRTKHIGLFLNEYDAHLAYESELKKVLELC